MPPSLFTCQMNFLFTCYLVTSSKTQLKLNYVLFSAANIYIYLQPNVLISEETFNWKSVDGNSICYAYDGETDETANLI